MSKTFLIYLNNIPKIKLEVYKKDTIKDVKKSIYNFLKENIYKYDIRMFINKNTEVKVFDDYKYDNSSLQSIWDKMKDSQIFLVKKITGYQHLPKDMKRYLTNYLEPLQVLETCKEMTCDWKNLLNLNYDYITQGFAIGNTDKEKFEYLAKRVSKNVDVENPEIIFIHLNGKQLGIKSFYKFFLDDEYDEDEETEQSKKIEKAIIDGLKESSGVEWIRRDDFNSWIKVIDRKELPNRFIVNPINSRGHRTILVDNVTYDYPNTRNKINLSDHIFDKKIFIKKLKEQADDLDQYVNDYFNESEFGENMYNYSIYDIMTDFGINKSEAEVFLNIILKRKNHYDYIEFLEKLEKYCE